VENNGPLYIIVMTPQKMFNAFVGKETVGENIRKWQM
jgi:hypothetical protein